jgi:hypothetical protein
VDRILGETRHPRYTQLINDGRLRLGYPPHQNTLSDWINDVQITPRSLLPRRKSVASIPSSKGAIDPAGQGQHVSLYPSGLREQTGGKISRRPRMDAEWILPPGLSR